MTQLTKTQEITIPVEKAYVNAFLSVPKEAEGIVLFAHGSGSSRFSPRNQYVAKYLQQENIGTLLLDLMTKEEEDQDNVSQDLRFDINFLAHRLVAATDWLAEQKEWRSFTIGYFGASTGAAAALVAASQKRNEIKAVVSRGGRPDLAGSALVKVLAPTLLIVGGNDFGVIELNQKAYDLLSCEKKLEIVPDATHLFEERGALERVAHLAAIWFNNKL